MVSIYFSIKHDDIIGIKMIAINNLLTEQLTYAVLVVAYQKQFNQKKMINN